MKTSLLVLAILFGASNLKAQTANAYSKSFVFFGMSKNNTYELKQLETILKDNSDFEMVRVDYSRNTVFVVSKSNVAIDETSMKSVCGNLFQLIKCSQYGVQGIDAVKFEELYECNSK